MLIAIPCAVGFITLAKPILNLLYFTQDNTKQQHPCFSWGRFQLSFFCLSTVTNSVLQGLDDMTTTGKKCGNFTGYDHIVTLFPMLGDENGTFTAVVFKQQSHSPEQSAY